MKLSCLRTDLVNAISNVSRAVSAKSSVPALEGVLIKAYDNKINISGYNLEIGITTDIEATVIDEGEIVISAHLFLEIVRKLPEEIVLIETDERLVTYIQCGPADYKIMGMSSVEYPDLPTFEQTDFITVDSKTLRDMIRQTVYAASDNNSKPIYMGSLFEIKNSTLNIVAIDGFRMAIRSESVDTQSNTSFVVPAKTQQEILKLLTDDEAPVSLIVGQRHINFQVKNYSVISRLIEGNFLDYHSTIPKEAKTELVISTRKMIESVERMSLLNSERTPSPVRCKFKDNRILLSCASAVGSAKDSIDVDIIGENVEIGFNNRYMLDALRNTDTDEVKMTLSGPVAPIVIRPVQGNSFLSIVVPMRLANEN